MTIMLPPEIEARLKAEAAKHGVDLNEYAQRLIAQSLPPQVSCRTSLFAKWDAEDETDDPEELARQRAEAEQFMQNLARNRIEMEGPNARKLWP
jgi:hypothetical protein